MTMDPAAPSEPSIRSLTDEEWAGMDEDEPGELGDGVLEQEGLGGEVSAAAWTRA
jgi:hypothetical protein